MVTWIDINSVYAGDCPILSISWFDGHFAAEGKSPSGFKTKGCMGDSYRLRISFSHINIERDLLEFKIFGLFGVDFPHIFFLSFSKGRRFGCELP